MSPYNVELVSETDAALDKLAENASSKADAIRKAIFVAAWVEEKQTVWLRISSSRMRTAACTRCIGANAGAPRSRRKSAPGVR